MVSSDRRRSERFSPRGKTIAAYRSRDGRVIVGPIRNISMGGLYFEYTDISISAMKTEGTVDIFLSDLNLYLPDIPCKIVHSIEVFKEDYSIGVPVPRMYCGLQFLDLLQNAKDSLDSMLSAMASSILNNHN